MRARRGWPAIAAAACLASSAIWLAGATAAGGPAVPVATAGGLRVLQLNLCNSGIARCYTGRAVPVAAELIRRERPAIVTLNEVCRGDVSALARALSAAVGGRPVAMAFRAAGDRRTHAAFRCVNGEPYGIGVVALRGPVGGHRTFAGLYPSQDTADPEERVWVCIVQPALTACTTHTDSHSTAVALAQCREFFGTGPPRLPERGDVRFVLGADLNLPAGTSPGPGACVPRYDRRVDDGGRQDVVADPSLTVRRRAVIDLHGATDHPALLVDLAARNGS